MSKGMLWQLTYLLENSWLPISMSMATFSMMSGTLLWFKHQYSSFLYFSMLLMLLTILFMWMRDLERESSYQGHHTLLVQASLKWGLMWFLFSEVWFFFSVFWSFFHVSSAPITSGSWEWPLTGVSIIPPFQVPLLNTIILLMSGLTATLAHQELLANKKTEWILESMMLGTYFLALQGLEYYNASYSLASSMYGSIFFFGTGFHGLHVCLGAMMLLVSMIRVNLMLVDSNHHFSLEFSLWYWHFVDVVWLFLFSCVYTWGSCLK